MKEVRWLTHNYASKIIKLGGERKEVILKSCNHSQIVQFLWCWKDNVKKKTYVMMEKMEQDLNNMYVDRRFGKLPQVNPRAMDYLWQLIYLWQLRSCYRLQKLCNTSITRGLYIRTSNLQTFLSNLSTKNLVT